MTKRRVTWLRRPLSSVLISAVAALALGIGTARATTVLNPSVTTVAPGGSFTVEFDDASFDPTIIFGINIDIGFDPNVLTFDSVAAGTLLPDIPLGDLTFNSIGSGLESLGICCWSATGVGNSLFTVAFGVLGTANPGPNPISTTVSFATDPVALNDPDGNGDGNVDTDGDGDGALAIGEYAVNPNPSLVTLQVTPLGPAPTPVPEPATGSLFLVGIAATAALRFRGFSRSRAAQGR